MRVNPNPRIVVAGAVGSTKTTLRQLLKHRATIVGVLGLSPDVAADVSGYTQLAELAVSAGLPYQEFRNINEDAVFETVRDWEPDVLFVVGLSQLVKQRLLSIPTLGSVGFHPTQLPVGRGRAPIAWLILERGPAAATFFQITESADAGPLFVQEPFDFTEADYASDVMKKLDSAMEKALDRWLPRLLAGEWKAIEQDHTKATFYGRRTPEDGLIDWRAPAEDIARLVRATSRPHPGAYTHYQNRRMIIWRADAVSILPMKGVIGRILEIDSEGGLVVQAGAGHVLVREYEILASDTETSRPRVGARLGFVLEDQIAMIHRHLKLLDDTLPGRSK